MTEQAERQLKAIAAAAVILFLGVSLKMGLTFDKNGTPSATTSYELWHTQVLLPPHLALAQGREEEHPPPAIPTVPWPPHTVAITSQLSIKVMPDHALQLPNKRR